MLLAEHVAKMSVAQITYIVRGSFKSHMIDGGRVREEDNIKKDRRCMRLE
jgi:fructose/tagatose bisphosphate aldolase